MPDRVRQSPETKAATGRFASAKRASSMLRAGLSKVIPHYTEKPLMYCIDKAVYNWIKHAEALVKEHSYKLPYLEGLQLNGASPSLEVALGFSPIVDWSKEEGVQVHLPAFDPQQLVLPKGTKALQFQLTASGAYIKNKYIGMQITSEAAQADIPVNGTAVAAQTLLIPFAPKAGMLNIVVLVVRYLVYGEWSEERHWMPMGVVGGCFVK
jgi:hypothetical protein